MVRMAVMVGVMIWSFNWTYTVPPGLGNCGNTCFLNAALQCLYNLTLITDDLIKTPNIYPDGSFGHYYTEVAKIYKQADLAMRVGNVNNIIQCAQGSPLFNLSREAAKLLVPLLGEDALNNGQQDATEAIIPMVDHLRSSLPNPKQLSPFSFYIGSIYRLTRECPEALGAPEQKREYELYKILPMVHPITAKVATSFEECLQNAYAPQPSEFMYEEKLLGCTDLTRIEESYGYLMFSINRFKLSMNQVIKNGVKSKVAFAQKINTPLQVSEEISIHDYVHNPTMNIDDYKYDLQGVIVHRGSITGGHYVAYVKKNNGTWFYCDDSSVRSVNYNDNQFMSDRGLGYVFFYKKSHITDSDIRRWRDSRTLWAVEMNLRAKEEEEARNRKKMEEEKKRDQERRDFIATLNALQTRLSQLALILQ
jgi:uncharacterized UBP type Zn finger protein